MDVHGVRFPRAIRARLGAFGASYKGWVANLDVPACMARHLFTVHVPRRCYAEALPGIPTIRVFEALACGLPLISAPWDDCERLFCPGEDFLIARNEGQMRDLMRAVAHDRGLAQRLAANGLAKVHARHTTRHRARELCGILSDLRGTRADPAAEVAL